MLETTGVGSVLREYIRRLSDKGLNFSSAGMWFAGGVIRRAICGHDIEKGDFDIYVTNDWKFEQSQKDHGWAISEMNYKHELRMVTYDIMIDNLRVQLHYMKEKPSISAILKTFDFTCCQFACEGAFVKYLSPALEDAKSLKLRYTGVEGQYTPSRAFRFMAMGFKASNQTLQELQKLAAAPSLEATNPKKAGKS